jgi:hypothetical protein
MNLRAILIASLLIPATQAQDIQGVYSGLVYDSQARAIRPIVGVPGASYLGPEFASNLDLAGVSPDGRFALAIRQGNLFLLSLADGGQRLLHEGLSSDLMVWNSTSTAAAVSSEDGITLWSNLNGEPARAALGKVGAVNAIAVNAEGTAVAAGASDGVYYLHGQSARLIASGLDAVAVAFAGGRLYAADRASNRVLALANLDESAAVTLVAGESMGIDGPVGLGEQNGMLVVASGGSKNLLWISSSGEVTRSIALDFSPDTLAAVPGAPSLYFLKSRSDALDSIQILDSRQEPAVFFVPAGAGAEN